MYTHVCMQLMLSLHQVAKNYWNNGGFCSGFHQDSAPKHRKVHETMLLHLLGLPSCFRATYSLGTHHHLVQGTYVHMKLCITWYIAYTYFHSSYQTNVKGITSSSTVKWYYLYSAIQKYHNYNNYYTCNTDCLNLVIVFCCLYVLPIVTTWISACCCDSLYIYIYVLCTYLCVF